MLPSKEEEVGITDRTLALRWPDSRYEFKSDSIAFNSFALRMMVK
jgi:hypothetical protein